MPPCMCAHVDCAAIAPLGGHSRAAPANCTSAAHMIRHSCLGSVSPRTQWYAGRRGRYVSRLQQPGTIRRRQNCTAAISSTGIELRHPDGRRVPMDKDVFTVGSSRESDLHVASDNVQPQHAQLDRKGGRLYCIALAGDAEEMLSDTYTWLDGSQLRHGVAYLVAPGAQLAFGKEDQQYTLLFEEEGSANPMMEMLMKGMASQGSDEVRKQMEHLQ